MGDVLDLIHGRIKREFEEVNDQHGKSSIKKAEQHLNEYIKQAWQVIEPGIDYMTNWHIDAICEYLEAVEIGQIKRLLINIPPRYMKSIGTTVMYPTWSWINKPHKRFIALSYSQSLSTKHSLDRRNIIKSLWYQSHWKDRFKLVGDQNTKTKFQNDKMGFMYATSIGGTLTGEGGDVIIVDDPHNPKMAESEAERNSALEFFRTTLPTRLNDKKKGAIIVVMQRLHEEDISGFVLKQGGYEHLCLPAEVHDRTIISLPISGKEIIREDGSLLWPEREGPEEIEQMKKALGSYGYSGQYDQDPAPAGGGIFKKHWWRYWQFKGQKLPPVTIKMPDGTYKNIEPVELPESFDEMLQSWDCAFKGGHDNDGVSGQVWAKKSADKFLLDRMYDKMTFTQTLQAIRSMSEKWPKTYSKLVEDKANGSAVIDTLQREISGLVAVNPEGGKEVRAQAASPQIESGNVFLPHPQIYDWVDSFIDTFAKFPKVKHDDDVDATTQALIRMETRFEPRIRELG
jgi:predicted phage terminase large subunit-like protein